MKNLFICLSILIFVQSVTHAQTLKIKKRKIETLNGSDFAKLIADTALSLSNRETLIFNEIKKGNAPNFLRKLCAVQHEVILNNEKYKITFFVIPDYLSIGNDEDYFYIPMTPILAQKVASLLECSLPTKKMVDLIYEQAKIKLAPNPIPPTKAMTTIPIFKVHSDLVKEQLTPYLTQHNNGELTAGNKKDIIISTKIYTENTSKVVIYGWHQLNGKAIQPVYNKHSNTWADYSHGVRLIQNKVFVNGKKTTLQKALKDPKLHVLLSDEGIIEKGYYPVTGY